MTRLRKATVWPSRPPRGPASGSLGAQDSGLRRQHSWARTDFKNKGEARIARRHRNDNLKRDTRLAATMGASKASPGAAAAANRGACRPPPAWPPWRLRQPATRRRGCLGFSRLSLAVRRLRCGLSFVDLQLYWIDAAVPVQMEVSQLGFQPSFHRGDPTTASVLFEAFGNGNGCGKRRPVDARREDDSFKYEDRAAFRCTLESSFEYLI
jgi:hypothetical protein